jgi:hypothetical protein
VLGGYGVESGGDDAEVERVGTGEEVEDVEGAGYVEELEAWEEEYSDVFGLGGGHFLRNGNASAISF